LNSYRGSRNHDVPLVEGLYYNTPTKVVDVISAGTQILISKFYKTHQNDPFFGEVEWVTVYATILYGDNKRLGGRYYRYI